MAKKEIKLGLNTINDSSPVYLIAEIGINHNGDLQIVKKLIDAANAVGWDCVKFQKRVPEIAVPEAQKEIVRDTPWGKMTYLEYKKRIEFGEKEYDYINQYCEQKPISWSASPWDLPSLEFILQYNIPFIKIASASNTNREILIEACKSKRPILMSTGMSTWEELDEAVNILEKYGDGNYALLHTNSSYPAPLKELNLKMIQTLKQRYQCIVGYSGHESNLEPSVLAVALGAQIIERHVTLSHDMWGTDQKASLEIPAMQLLKGRIIGVQDIIGSGERIISDSELNVRKKLRGY